MSLKCYYHPEREAQSKCDKCGKLICLECKKSFNVIRSSSERSYSTRHEYCQVCYFKHQSLSVYSKPCFFITAIIMMTVFLIISNEMIKSTGFDSSFQNFLIPIIIVLFIAFIFSIIYGVKKRAKIKSQKEDFLMNVKKSSRKKEVKIPICKKCGKKVDLNAMICPYCGSDIEK